MAVDHNRHGTVERAFVWLGARIAAKPLLTLIVIGLISVGFGAGILKLQVNNSNDIFFVEDDPLLKGHREFQEIFGSDEFVLVFLEGDIFRDPLLSAAREAVDKMEAVTFNGERMFPGVLSPLNAPVIRAGAGTLDIGPVIKDRTKATDKELDEARAILTSHPIYRNLLIRPDGTAAAIVGTMRADDAVEYQAAVASAMFDIAKDPRLINAGVRLVGNPIFKSQIDAATVKEASMFGSLGLLVALIALFILFRRARQVAAALAVVVLAVLWTLGLMALLGVEMNVISIILPLIVVIMGLGDSVHIINGFRHQRFLGKRRREAVTETLPETGIPCLLTSITTAIGFLSMLTAPVAPLRTLGIFIAIGVMFCLILSVTLVPAVLAFGEDAPPDEVEGKAELREAAIDERFNRWFGKLGDLVVGHAPMFAIGLGLFAVAVGFGAKDLIVESHPLYQFRADVPFRQDVQKVDEQLGGTTSVEVVLDTGLDRGVWDPDFVARIDIFQKWILETQGDVVGAALSLSDLLREIRFALAGTRELPTTRAEIAQLLLIYESGDGDLRLVADSRGRRARMSVRLRLASNNRNLELEKALLEKAAEVFKDWKPAPFESDPASNLPPSPESDDDTLLIIEEDDVPAEDAGSDVIIIIEEEDPPPVPGSTDGGPPPAAPSPGASAPSVAVPNAPAPTDAPEAKLEISLAGTSQLFVHLAAYVVKSQVQSFLIALVIIGLLMMLVMRSVTLGLVVLLPNILPILCTYGFMGYTGLWVDYLTSTIAVGALGVAVDGTIHIGTRFRRNRLLGMDARQAAHDVMVAVGRALVVTSVVLVAGFLVLIPSMLASLATFGGLMALCLGLALVFDLVMTPAVLAWLNPGVGASGDAANGDGSTDAAND